MSLDRRIFFGAVASWFSRATTIILGVVLLPVLFRNLAQEELGVWLLLGQSWAALGILDLGFGVTLTRQIAFAKGKSGTDPEGELNNTSLMEIADILATGLKIYRGLAVIALFLSLGLGAFYVSSLTLNDVPTHQVWIAWGILCISYSINTWAAPWVCLLQGIGYVGWDSLLNSLVNAITLIVQIIIVLVGGGLIGLSITAFLGALVQRFILISFSIQKNPNILKISGEWRYSIWAKMYPLAFRAWLTALGSTLVLNTDQLFIAKMDGASSLPMYRAAYLIFLNLNVLSVTIAAASSVFVSHLWLAQDLKGIQRIVIRNSRLGLFIMASGGGCILGLGPVFFDSWLGAGNFIGYPVAIAFFILLLFEAQSYIISTASRATEDEAFVVWSLGAGALKMVLAWILGYHLGILGVALGTLFAQLFTNHWFMSYRGLSRLKISIRLYVNKVFIPMLLLLLGCVSVAYCISNYISLPVVWLSMIAFAITGAFLMLVLWFGVLDALQRNGILRRFSSLFNDLKYP